MDYVQLTIDDWLRLKEELKDELIGVKRSFVRIGYRLRRIRDERLYERDGYKSIAEFAYSEYRLQAHTVSRMIAINEAYSVDGYSDSLRPEFADLEQSKLEEMLQLPANDREIIRPEIKRESIRDLKQFNRQAPENGIADGITELIRKFFDDNETVKEELLNSEAYHIGDITGMVEIINPSGNRTYRKGLYFVVMYEDCLKIKKHGGQPETMSWEQFFEMANLEPVEKIAPAQTEVIDTEEERLMETSEPIKGEPSEILPKPIESQPEEKTEPDKQEQNTEIKKTEQNKPKQNAEKPEDKRTESEKRELKPEMDKIELAERCLEHLNIAVKSRSWDTAIRKIRKLEETIMLIRLRKTEDKNQMNISDYPELLPEGGSNA